MKWLASLFCACCFLVMPAAAQNVEIKGLVLGADGEGVPYANLTVEQSGDNPAIIAYAVSDFEGNFSLKFSSIGTIVKISVSALGYAEKTITYKDFTNREIKITLDPSPTNLKEIVVKAKKKIGDTLSISLNEMNLRRNDNLEKILQRTAGVILGEDGKISYRGKQITKVMVNQWSVANLSPPLT